MGDQKVVSVQDATLPWIDGIHDGFRLKKYRCLKQKEL